MNKKIKAIFYGDIGVGKSVFAFGSSKPFFITTDNNYAYLDDWGAKEEDHVQVNSWAEAKEEFNKPLDEYDTIVVDLIEDLYVWCEDEFVKQNKITHLSDLGYGKGYQLVRKDFYLTIKSLINRDKHIILLSHAVTIKNKDKRGVEYLKFTPSDKIPDKLWPDISGLVRYCLRCYATPEEDEDGNLSIKRYLSLSPDGTTEYGVIRGIPDTKFPAKIPLDWNTFVETVGLSAPSINARFSSAAQNVEPTVNEAPSVAKRPVKSISEQAKEIAEELKPAEEPVVEDTKTATNVDVNKLTKGTRRIPARKLAAAKEPEAPVEEKVTEEPAKVEEATVETEAKEVKSDALSLKQQKILDIKNRLAKAKAAKE